MKKIFPLLLTLASFQASFAQNLTLEGAIELGLKNRYELQSAYMQLKIDQQQNKKINASWLPQVSANGDFRYNSILQKSVLPIGDFGIPGISPGATSTVAFGVPYNTTIGLDAQQKLLDLTKKIDRKINNNSVENQLLTIEIQKTNVRNDISEAYFYVLYQKEKIKLAQEAVVRAQTNLENGQTRLKAGTALTNDIERLALDLSNQRLASRKAKQDYEFSMDQLKFRMNVNQDTTLEISESLQSLVQKKAPSSVPPYSNNNTIRKEEIARLGNQLQAKKMLKRNAPTLSAYGNISLLALNEDVYPFSYLGLQTSITLFGGQQAKFSAQDYQIRSQMNQVNIEKYRLDLDFEIRSVKKSMEYAQLDLEESEKNITLAKHVYANDQFRFEKGNIVLSELKNSEFTLLTAENNYLITAYNYLLIMLKLEKLLGQ
jgi:outer membrane protein TolC